MEKSRGAPIANAARMATDTAKTPLRTRHLLAADGDLTAENFVSCPHDGRVLSLDECSSCGRLIGASKKNGEIRIECEVSKGKAKVLREREARARAQETPVWYVMSSEVTCVTTTTTVEMVSELLIEKGLRSVPVVDEAGKLCGIVTRSDLLRTGFEDRGITETEERVLPGGFHATVIATRLVGEIMTPVVHALPEDAPFSFAVALMARANLHEVPVVAPTGNVVGMITSIDVIRWLATDFGYVTTNAGQAAPV